MSILLHADTLHILSARVCNIIRISTRYGYTIYVERQADTDMVSGVADFYIELVYYLFNNNIAGPMQFRITDRPIDTPSQWGNNWRLYWIGVYASTVAWIGGVISIVVMLLYNLYKVWQRR